MRKTTVIMIIALIAVLGSLGWLLSEDKYPNLYHPIHNAFMGRQDISILDLYATVWDVDSAEVVGRYNGEVIRRNQFEVWSWASGYDELQPIKVVLCCPRNDWMLEMEEKLEENDPDYTCYEFSGILKVLDKEGNVLVIIK